MSVAIRYQIRFCLNLTLANLLRFLLSGKLRSLDDRMIHTSPRCFIDVSDNCLLKVGHTSGLPERSVQVPRYRYAGISERVWDRAVQLFRPALATGAKTQKYFFSGKPVRR